METSGRALTNLGETFVLYEKEKFVFGTDSPVLDKITGLLRIGSLRTNETSESTKELLKPGNAKEFFNL